MRITELQIDSPTPLLPAVFGSSRESTRSCGDREDDETQSLATTIDGPDADQGALVVPEADKVSMADLCSGKYSRHGGAPMTRTVANRLKKRKMIEEAAGGVKCNDSSDDEAAHTRAAKQEPFQAGGEPAAPQYSGPRVRVVDGRVVLDQQSLALSSNPSSAQALSQLEEVEEDPTSKHITSATYMKVDRGARWTAAETDLFYEGLGQWGTDFEMLARNVFPTRTRHQIKSKFCREERRCPQRVESALKMKRPALVTIPLLTQSLDTLASITLPTASEADSMASASQTSSSSITCNTIDVPFSFTSSSVDASIGISQASQAAETTAPTSASAVTMPLGAESILKSRTGRDTNDFRGITPVDQRPRNAPLSSSAAVPSSLPREGEVTAADQPLEVVEEEGCPLVTEDFDDELLLDVEEALLEASYYDA